MLVVYTKTKVLLNLKFGSLDRMVCVEINVYIKIKGVIKYLVEIDTQLQLMIIESAHFVLI